MTTAEKTEFATKKSLHAAERDPEANQKRREEFVDKIRMIALERLIFLDESGVSTSMTRLYARDLVGLASVKARPIAAGRY